MLQPQFSEIMQSFIIYSLNRKFTYNRNFFPFEKLNQTKLLSIQDSWNHQNYLHLLNVITMRSDIYIFIYLCLRLTWNSKVSSNMGSSWFWAAVRVRCSAQSAGTPCSSSTTYGSMTSPLAPDPWGLGRLWALITCSTKHRATHVKFIRNKSLKTTFISTGFSRVKGQAHCMSAATSVSVELISVIVWLIGVVLILTTNIHYCGGYVLLVLVMWQLKRCNRGFGDILSFYSTTK